MTSKKKISYVKRHFFYLFLLVVMLVGIMGLAIMRFSKEVVGNEIVKLHQAILKQSASHTADVLGALKESLSNIVQNAKVTQWLARGEGAEANFERTVGVTDSASMAAYVDGFVQDEIYKNYKQKNIIRIYIYDLQRLRYGSDRPAISWEAAMDAVKREEALGGDAWGKAYLEGPIRSEEEGLYRYSFYLMEPVKDLISQRIEGYVLLQFGEKTLYGTYSDLRGKDRYYSIINGDGNLVSGEDKTEIGSHWLTADAGRDDMSFYENILGTDWYLAERIHVHDIWEALDRSGLFSFSLIVIFVLCLYPLTLFSGRRIIKPVDKIKDKMNQVAEGGLSVRISEEERGRGEFAEIGDSFNYMVERLEKQMEEIRSMDRKKHLLELDFLQAQINPHFIYNTLSSIRFYVEMGKNEEAEEMLIDFSKILRKTLSRTEQLITLKEELTTLRHYVNLQKARYRERFEVAFEIQEDTLFLLVPDFILQPIVENAIFYSIREEKICHVRISSWIDHEYLRVSVKDDGIGMDVEKIDAAFQKDLNMNKVGIKNVNERLRLNFGEACGLKIISEEGRGTTVILTMPSTNERKRLR